MPAEASCLSVVAECAEVRAVEQSDIHAVTRDRANDDVACVKVAEIAVQKFHMTLRG